MTHDPLCPRYDHVENHEDTYWCSDRCDTDECQCDLIAEVRADEAPKAVDRYLEERRRAVLAEMD